MTNEDLVEELREIGLTVNEAKIYVSMLGRPLYRAAEIAQVADVPRPKVYEALGNLVVKGFCYEINGVVAQYSAIAPQEALEALRRRQEMEAHRLISERQIAVERLVEHLTPLHTSGKAEIGLLRYIDILTERARVNQVANDLLNRAERSIIILEKEPYAQDASILNAYEIAAIERGVQVRCIFESSVRNLSRRATSLLQAGADVRVGNFLPMKLIVSDDIGAICAMRDPVSGQQTLTSLRIEHADFTAAMRLLFDSIWVQSTPFSPTESQPGTNCVIF